VRTHSLTARLAITAVALVAVMAVLIGVATTLVMRHTLTDRLDDEVSSALDGLLEGPPGRPGGEGTIDPRNQAPGTLLVVLGGDRGDQGVVVGNRPGEYGEVDPAAFDELRTMDHGNRVDEVDLPQLGNYRVDSTMIGEFTVIVGLPTDDVDDAVQALIWAELALALLAVAAAAAAGTFVVRRQLAPLREVAATAHAVAELPLSEGAIDMSARVPERLTDERNEVGQVGSALNTLLDHVETSLAARHRSEQQVRQFVADASHELRTPLATIAGYTELARRQPAATATALDKVESESARMTSLVEDLLLLARLDSGRPLADDPVDLTKLLLEAVGDARVLGPDHTWRLALPDEPVEVRGDEQRLHQVVTNLLTNARKHTPPGTTVTVTASTDGFVVHDDGPGLPAGLLDHAFERFVRADEARTSAGGAGLGLALVDAIISAHGGRVTLTSRPGDTAIAVHL